ncbi:MAG: nicotinate phosphoribosyltransferase [Gammaproteobacteria bacterium]
MIDIARGTLLTDLYQLTMLQAYVQHGLEDTAVFEFFIRKLPEQRGFLMAAGLEQALQYLEELHFTAAELEWLAGTGKFKDDFLDYLKDLRFRGDVHAMLEGTVFFSDEPILRVTAPLPQAQLVESRLINLLHFQTMIASKAARCVLAAPGKLLVDFGFRRAHGAEAGVLAARAAYLAGFDGTATVAAGALFDIPTYGTMAHSFIQTHDDESAAFAEFAVTNPGAVVLLIDTYDTEGAADKVVALAPQLQSRGISVMGVRIDSGDLAAHARRVRRILDDGGLHDVTIFASSSVDEYLIKEHTEHRIPIDGYGIGTHLDTSADAPDLDCAYNLQEYAGWPRRKRSEGKATWPGRKQVFRYYGGDGSMLNDVVTLESDSRGGQPLLRQVMRAGLRTEPAPSLAPVREYAARELASLPPPLRELGHTPPYPVRISEALADLAARLDGADRES